MGQILLPELATFRKTVDQVIEGSKYLHLQDRENIWEKITNAITRFLERWSPRGYSSVQKIPSGVENGWLLILIIVLGLALYFYFNKEKDGKDHKKVLYGEVIEEDTKHEGLFAKAEALEREGNYREAVRLYFISILIYMNEKSLCFLGEAKTNEEIIQDLQSKAFTGWEHFKTIGDYFYYIWYGNKDIDGEKLLWYKEKVNNLFTEVKNYHGE